MATGSMMTSSNGDSLSVMIVLVGPNDAGYFEAVFNVNLDPTVATAPSIAGPAGGFVDLMYPVQAGGSIRGAGILRNDIHTLTKRTAILAPSLQNLFFQTRFSGYSSSASSGSFPQNYPESLFRSGKIISDGADPATILVYQPCYDTYTDAYESDGSLQRDATSLTGVGSGTLWWLNNNDGTTPAVTIGGVSFGDYIDAGANGLDDFGTMTGADNVPENETSAPFVEPLTAIKVSLRVENPITRQIQQLAITEDL